MDTSEDEAEVEALLKQIAAAKHKELRLRVEKKRVRDELEQLQEGKLWTREEQTQKQLLGVRQAKEQLEAKKKTEQEKLLILRNSLKEQELKFRNGTKAKPSPFQLAAASVVATSPRVNGESNQKENANELQKDEEGLDKPRPLAKVSPQGGSSSSKGLPIDDHKETSTQKDSLLLLIRNLNCDEQQKRVEKLQVELEKANSRRQEFNFNSPSSTMERHSSYDFGKSKELEPELKETNRVTREVEKKPVHITPLDGPQLPNYPPSASDSPATSTYLLGNMHPAALPTAPIPPYPAHFAAGYPQHFPVSTAYPLYSPMMPINPYGIGFPPQCFASPYPAPPWSYSYHMGSVLPPVKPVINQQDEEICRLDMQRIDNEQQAEAKEFARIQGRLQALQTKISSLTVTDASPVDSANEAAVDDMNEPGLSSLKRQHLESLAKVRNERNLLEEQEKLDDLKERIQRRREEKKRELDHEEWVAKQKREIVSLRLQRVIQHSNVDNEIDIQAESSDLYNLENGFAIFWDFATGVPATANELQLTYAAFEGKTIRTPFKVVPAKEIQTSGSRHKLCVFLSPRHIKRIPASSELRVIVELASLTQNGAGGQRTPTTLGWTAFDIFKLANKSELVLNCGYLKLPVRQSSMPDPSKTLASAPHTGECGDMKIYVRLVPGDRIEEASRVLVDPEQHAARYQSPDTGNESLRPQSKRVTTGRPPIQGRRTPSEKISNPPNDQKTTPPTPKQDFLDVDRLRSLSTASSRPPSTRPDLPPTGDKPRLSPLQEDAVDEPWIRVDKTLELQRRLLRGDLFQSGDGFDLSVDGGRGFPDSTTISKVTIAALDADRIQVTAENGSGFADLTSNTFDPGFDTYVEYRQSSFNPTLTLVIRVDTIELVSKRPVILGYCVFPVFIDVESRDQPTRPSIRQFILNEGGFQLPLHTQVQTAEANQPLSAKSCEEFPRVPCATVLLRIVRATLSGDGMTLLSRKDFPAPLYIDQVYDSLRSIPSGIEEKIYAIRQKNRRPKTVAQCLQQMSLSSSESQDMLTTKPSTYLDLSTALRYEPAMGFRVAVDALYNVKAKGGPFFKVLYSVYPPGSFYQTIRLTGDVYFTTTMDWSSSQTSPEFSDGFMTLRDSPSDQLLLVLFDVRSCTRHPKTGAITLQQYAWTFLPVLANSRSVNTCSVQLPLFQGNVNLDIFKATVGELSELVNDIGKEKVKALVPVTDEGASLFVRLQDPQLSLPPAQPIVGASLSKMIPPRLRSKYVYDSVKIAAQKRKNPLSKLLPTNIPAKQLEKELNQAFAKEMDIHHLFF